VDLLLPMVGDLYRLSSQKHCGSDFISIIFSLKHLKV